MHTYLLTVLFAILLLQKTVAIAEISQIGQLDIQHQYRTYLQEISLSKDKSILFIGLHSEIIAVDVSEDTAPQVISKFGGCTPEGGGSFLCLYNLTNLKNSKLGSLVFTTGRSVLSNEDKLWRYTFEIIDYSSPSSPRLIGRYISHDELFDFDISTSEDLAYIAAGQSGLLIIDISNKSSPKKIGILDTPGFATSVRFLPEKNIVLVTEGIGGGVLSIDVSNPSAPYQIGKLDISDSNIWGVTVLTSSDKGLLSDKQSNNLFQVDIKKPTSLNLTSTLPGIGSQYNYATNNNNTLLFVLNGSQLNVYDIRLISTPALINTYTLDYVSTRYSTGCQSITTSLDQTKLYLGCHSSSLTSIDTDISNIRILEISDLIKKFDDSHPKISSFANNILSLKSVEVGNNYYDANFNLLVSSSPFEFALTSAQLLQVPVSSGNVYSGDTLSISSVLVDGLYYKATLDTVPGSSPLRLKLRSVESLKTNF